MLSAQRIRKIVGSAHCDFALGEYHVRRYRDGDVWVFPQSDRQQQSLRAILEAAGLICKCNGKPGTSGERIIEVFEG